MKKKWIGIGGEYYLDGISWNSSDCFHKVEDAIEYIKEVAQNENIDFYNFNDNLSEIGIDKSVDFNDHTHLSYWGSIKFTNYFGDILKDKNLLIDKRGNKQYNSWDANAKNIIEQVH